MCDKTPLFPQLHMCDMTCSKVAQCDMTNSYVRHDSFLRVPRLIHSSLRVGFFIDSDSGCPKEVFSLSFIRRGATWRAAQYDMTNSYVCHDAFLRVPWLSHVCYWVWVAPDSELRCKPHAHTKFACEPWLLHMCLTVGKGSHKWMLRSHKANVSQVNIS